MKRIENPHVAAAEGNRRQIKNIPEIIHRRRKTSVLPPAASAIKGITQSPACNYPSTEGLALMPPQNTAWPRFSKTRQIPQHPSSSPLTAAAAGKRHHKKLPHLAGRIRTKRKIPRHKDHFFPCTPAIFRNLPASRNPVAAQRKEMAAPASMAHGEWAPNTLKELFSHALTASPPR